MTDTEDLYQEMILDHYKSPRNFGKLDAPDSEIEGRNPLCGDHLVLQVRFEGDQVAEVAFEGSGCAISTASASVMTEVVRGMTRSEFGRVFEAFHAMVTGGVPDTEVDLGKLAAFGGVSKFPARVKCAALAWHTAKAAVEGKQGEVSTEDSS